MTKVMTIAALLGVLGLAACGNGGSAVETRDRDAEAVDAVSVAAEPGDDPDARIVPAKPVLTANRRESVDDKVTRLFERNGAAFGARSAEDYLTKLEAFTGHPPADAETVKRPNGDTLIYQASTNTFAVVKSDGTPRTMFKPDNGLAYWAEQKAAAPTFGQDRKRSDG
ncbi:MAG: S-type pyocin family protein [Brevundimonas sp.]|nr:MAG: S-type pyocin family protein [Brevundimonas sp.]